MPPTKESLRQFQWSREAVKGTDLAATSKIICERIDFEDDNVYERPQLAKGLMVRNPGNELVAKRGTKFTVPDFPMAYEQIQNWLSMAIKGAVVPSGAGPYVWDFARTLTADPALDAFTLERRLSDGSTNVDHAWHYAQLTKVTWKGNRGSSIKMSAEGFARRRQLEAFTPALSMPTPEIAVFGNAKMYLDPAWASLGSTQITLQLYGFSIEYNTGNVAHETAEGRTDLDYSLTAIDASQVGLNVELMLLLDPTRYASEILAAEAQTLRAVRVIIDNGIVGANQRAVKWDMLLKHEVAPVKVDEQDGQDVVSFRMVDATDGTNMFLASVTNGVSSLT